MPGYATLMNSQVGQTIVVRARDGSEIVALGPSYGEWLRSDEIPQVMKDAMVSVEDRRFHSHFGVDPLGLARAASSRCATTSSVRATSTITQQLARNVFLNSNRTIDRKLREAVLAMALEWKFSKEQILELYLNKVYFGGGAYGIDSASRKFFSHSARDLTRPPRRRSSPGWSRRRAAIRRPPMRRPRSTAPTWCSQQMRKYGAIGADELAAVDLDAVKLKSEEGQDSVRYFTDWALPQLDLLLRNDSMEPIEVWTTLDPGMQRAASAAIDANAPGGAQGALVSLDRDGAVLALVGGTDYVKSSYNRATEAQRQPGSAWKLFVYLTALEAGYTPDDGVKDVPVTIDGWSPRNSNGKFAGEVNVRTAFAYSINTVAAQLGNEVGFSSVAGMARRFGITSPINTNPSMVLGTSEVRVIDMTRAFAAVAAGGRSVEPYGITRVVSASGEVLYRHQARGSRSSWCPTTSPRGSPTCCRPRSTPAPGARRRSAGRWPARPAPPARTRTAGSSASRAGSPPACGWAATTPRRCPGCRAAPRRRGRSRASCASRCKDRPIEQFQTEVKLPEWQLEPDEEWMYGGAGRRGLLLRRRAGQPDRARRRAASSAGRRSRSKASSRPIPTRSPRGAIRATRGRRRAAAPLRRRRRATISSTRRPGAIPQ